MLPTFLGTVNVILPPNHYMSQSTLDNLTTLSLQMPELIHLIEIPKPSNFMYCFMDGNSICYYGQVIDRWDGVIQFKTDTSFIYIFNSEIGNIKILPKSSILKIPFEEYMAGRNYGLFIK